MKIIKLLEGSELLYHVTDAVSMRGILKLGGLQLSDLRYSSFERGLIDELFPNGKHGDKLYYLSMSRNRANSFVNDQMFRRILFRFCLRGRSISKYGRIVPINYFNDVRIRGEMEDRLISDHNLIPLSLVDHVDVFINGSLGDEDFALLRAIEVRVPCRYFTTKMNFLMGRNAVEIGDLSGYELEVDAPSEIHGNESRIDALGRYLSGDYSDADLDEIRWRDAWWISDGLGEHGLATGTDVGHKLRMVLRAGGIKGRHGVYDLIDRIMGEKK
jgi:hypothetical protein